MLLLLLLLAAFFIGVPIWVSERQAEQEQRNADLIISASLGQVADVKDLLDRGADPNA